MNELFLYGFLKGYAGNPKGEVFTVFLGFAYGYGFLRLWVFLGKSLGFLPLEEIESFIGFEDSSAGISDLEVAVGALDFTCNGYFGSLSFYLLRPFRLWLVFRNRRPSSCRHRNRERGAN
jgi:hypothetical protein